MPTPGAFADRASAAAHIDIVGASIYCAHHFSDNPVVNHETQAHPSTKWPRSHVFKHAHKPRGNRCANRCNNPPGFHKRVTRPRCRRSSRNTWDHLAEQAHRSLTRPRHGDLTPAVTLAQSLHKQPPQSPAAICAHLETASAALPQLARYARSGDRHALLMAAVLMRHPLRRIAEMADPDGYRSSDRYARDNDTLRIFFEIIRTAAEPQILTSRYLYGQTLKRVLKARPDAVDRPSRCALTPTPSSWIDPTSAPTTTAPPACCSWPATDASSPPWSTTPCERSTSTPISSAPPLLTLGANVSAVERRAQRAIRKLCTYYEAAAAA